MDASPNANEFEGCDMSEQAELLSSRRAAVNIIAEMTDCDSTTAENNKKQED